MIRRLHARAGIYVSGLLLLVWVALAAQATQAVTESQMHEYVLAAIGAAGVVVFGAFWILLVTISGRSEKALVASVQRLEKAVAVFADALTRHDESPFAHRAASEHNHKPLEDKIDATKKDLDDFIEWCRRHQCVGLPRDPSGSPHRRRATDPPDFDAPDMELRGPKP